MPDRGPIRVVQGTYVMFRSNRPPKISLRLSLGLNALRLEASSGFPIQGVVSVGLGLRIPAAFFEGTLKPAIEFLSLR